MTRTARETTAGYGRLSPWRSGRWSRPGAPGASYQAEYLELTEGATVGARLTGGAGTAYAIRIPKFPTERPMPAQIVVEVAVLGR